MFREPFMLRVQLMSVKATLDRPSVVDPQRQIPLSDHGTVARLGMKLTSNAALLWSFSYVFKSRRC